MTSRQRQILLLVAAGHTNTQIAHQLGIRPSTVQNHLTHTYQALDARDRAHAVTLAIWHGHITLADLADIAHKDAA